MISGLGQLNCDVQHFGPLTDKLLVAGDGVELETMYSQISGQVGTIVLNRPDVLNCANEQWARDLNSLLDNLAASNYLRVVVVRGAGRAF
jgi:hypothetical protein